MGYIIAIDVGTTTTRAVLLDRSLRVVAVAKRKNSALFPRPGWVEQNPEELWFNVMSCVGETAVGREVEAIGVTNQRETVVMWDRSTGKPVYNAIVWQCKRTAPMVEELKRQGYEEEVRKRTGLPISSYFSATKIKWILDNVPKAKRLLKEGNLLFGTVDTYIIWKLSGGDLHVTDVSNASRTLLFNIRKGDWDDELLEMFGVPRDILPEVRASSEVYGYSKIVGGVPIAGDLGDQQASLVGQLGIEKWDTVATYGTGGFIKMNLGGDVKLVDGLATTVAYKVGKSMSYMLEGSIFVAGSLFQWLIESAELAKDYEEIERLGSSVEDTGGVYFVPAFAGLGAPYWDEGARALIIGMTRKTRREHILRAAMESIGYQSRDVLELFSRARGSRVEEMRVGGGVARNDFILQFLADITGSRILRPREVETTAIGAGIMAGLAVSFWSDLREAKSSWKADRVFEPSLREDERERLYKGWRRAVERSLGWAT